MWNFERRSKFIKQYKQLDTETKKKIDGALYDLATSENPAQVGVYKPSMRIFAYEVGKTHRIIYSVRHRDGIIELLRVCDHKSVYGKD